jgi:hypothetical protein
MQFTKKLFFALAGIAAAGLVVVGCATTQAAAPAPTEKVQKESASDRSAERVANRNKVKNKKYVAVSDSASDMGLPMPKWVAAYIQNGGNRGVEKLDDFKGEYCFVINMEDSNKSFADDWVKNPANAAQQIGGVISTSVIAAAQTQLKGQSGADVKGALDNVTHAMSNASFRGMTFQGDYWRELQDRSTGKSTFRAWGLWTIKKAGDAGLDAQITAIMKAGITGDNQTSMSENERTVYNALINRYNGTGTDQGFGNSTQPQGVDDTAEAPADDSDSGDSADSASE